ncbi:MAG: MFS transporter, partial [Rhizobiales bacterium]|nr:MFS transporter [Hyphomicrobiales bacterium]
MHPGILAAIAAVGVFATTLGISYPLLALVLDRAGQSQSFIGLNAAMAPLGFLISAPLIPWAAARINPVKLAIAATTATGLLMASFAMITDPYWWFVLRFF